MEVAETLARSRRGGQEQRAGRAARVFRNVRRGARVAGVGGVLQRALPVDRRAQGRALGGPPQASGHACGRRVSSAAQSRPRAPRIARRLHGLAAKALLPGAWARARRPRARRRRGRPGGRPRRRRYCRLVVVRLRPGPAALEGRGRRDARGRGRGALWEGVGRSSWDQPRRRDSATARRRSPCAWPPHARVEGRGLGFSLGGAGLHGPEGDRAHGAALVRAVPGAGPAAASDAHPPLPRAAKRERHGLRRASGLLLHQRRRAQRGRSGRGQRARAGGP
mmetsp:Transcript_76994/g.214039  ORF Transcript_76994/g.214039 Transcript_76994/m.214039 type:complete len:279 (+) Transcript_76994:290-1126(+)